MFGAGDDAHRRRPGGVPAAQEQRPQVGERRHRARDRLRHRAATPTRRRRAVAALQWVVGLELFLLSADPWRVVLSTDHPNGGSFMSYPELIRLLMDRTYRDEQLERVNQKLLAGSALADGLAREYTLNEIAIVTRAGPARLLGLRDKGHLGVRRRRRRHGLRAATPTWRRCSRRRATWSRAATLVVEEGQLRRAPRGPAAARAARLRRRRRARLQRILRSVRHRGVRELSRRRSARRAGDGRAVP